MVLLQPRDLQVFAELSACRFLSLPQLAQLCFAGNLETARKRTQKLREAGYVEYQRLLYAVPACVWLTSKVNPLLERGWLSRSRSHRPNPSSLRHELVIRDIRMRLLLDAPGYGMEIEAVCIQAEDISFHVGGRRHQPDAFIALGCRPTKHYFLEVDLGTESIPVFLRKIGQYERLFKSGLFASRFEAPLDRYRAYPFQVLVVFDSATRQERVLSALREYGVRHFVLAAALEEACNNPFGEIWTSPAGTSKATIGWPIPPDGTAAFG